MKFYILLALCLVQLVFSKPQSDQDMEAEKKLIMECMGKEGATEADLAEMMEWKFPSTHSGACLNACLMETIGVITDGKLSAEASVVLGARQNGNNEDKLKIIKEVATECSNNLPAHADRCEYSNSVLKCSDDGAEARGITQKYLFSP